MTNILNPVSSGVTLCAFLWNFLSRFVNFFLSSDMWESGRGIVVSVLDRFRTLGSWVQSPYRAWFAFEV